MSAQSNALSPSTDPDDGIVLQPEAIFSPVEDVRQQLAGTNINAQTFLATDYLNHFNEIIMLIEMVPSMPECLVDIFEWQPKTYENHFSDSGFCDKDLAIRAYKHAPDLIRLHFDKSVADMERCIIDNIETLKETYEFGDPEHVAILCNTIGTELKHHIDQISAIINGTSTTDTGDGFTTERESVEKTQSAVDDLFGN